MPSLKELSKDTLVFYISLGIWVAIISLIVIIYSFNIGKHETAEKLLDAFYTFDLNTISENDKQIQKLASKEIYESHTISSSTRQLRVYLKFEGNPTEAVILSHNNNKIVYYINSTNFDPERTFALEYKYSMGKIVDILEYEMFFLPQSSRDDLEWQ